MVNRPVCGTILYPCSSVANSVSFRGSPRPRGPTNLTEVRVRVQSLSRRPRRGGRLDCRIDHDERLDLAVPLELLEGDRGMPQAELAKRAALAAVRISVEAEPVVEHEDRAS